MIDIKKVQEIGSLVCSNCKDGRDCGIEPKTCKRIKDAIMVLNDDNFIYQDLREWDKKT